jgi:hypothetical protein
MAGEPAVRDALRLAKSSIAFGPFTVLSDVG